MDWFETLTGFREASYFETRSKLRVDGDRLTSLVNEKSYGIGKLEIPPLEELRRKVAGLSVPGGGMRVEVVGANVRDLHRERENRGALFQVASQFNFLEMIGPNAVPEDGVTIYASDHTQGPVCAMECGAATIYRNYLVPVGDQSGQTKHRQIDASEKLGQALSAILGRPTSDLWQMQNGYLLCSNEGLRKIDNYLRSASEIEIDSLRACLRIGLHSEVEVTTMPHGEHRVGQAFCSALPISYSAVEHSLCERFATLILEAAYEATLLCAVASLSAGKSDKVFLTMMGGGAFGNEEAWILAALNRALAIAKDVPIDVRSSAIINRPQICETLSETSNSRQRVAGNPAKDPGARPGYSFRSVQ